MVRLSVFDVLGREVTTLVDGLREAGNYQTAFDGSRLPSGVYVARLDAGEFSRSRKMVLLK